VGDRSVCLTQAAESKRWLTSRFTWFYIAAQNVWVFFIISLAFKCVSRPTMAHHNRAH
jgi:choline-glycine betaine transporter